MAGPESSSVLGHPLFVDISEEELQAATQHLTAQTATFQDMVPHQQGIQDLSLDALTQIPEHIVALIPPQVCTVLQCDNGRPLLVLRNQFFADVCCGKARVTKWFWHFGKKGIAIDTNNGPQFDLTTLAGLALAVVAILRIVPLGVAVFAPQCSNFLWLCRSVTKRSADNPYGDTNNRKVVHNNKLNLAVAILQRIASAWQVLWLTEQPEESSFFDTDEQKACIADCGAGMARLKLKPYGHNMDKPLKLVGTVPWLHNLDLNKKVAGKGQAKATKVKKVQAKATKVKKQSKAKETAAWSRDAKGRVTGKKAGLKASQVYPVAFAYAIAANSVAVHNAWIMLT